LPDTRDEIVAVLDACVLLPASLRDTLLRLAETPRLYVPKWSRDIWGEVTRNLESRRKLTPEKIAHLVQQVDLHFPEALIDGYEKLTARMTNHPKDRHVVAAAVRGSASVIVTANLRDFPAASLAPWDIEARHPDDFLLDLNARNPKAVASRLQEQSTTIGRTLPELLRTLHSGVPRFAAEDRRGTGFTQLRRKDRLLARAALKAERMALTEPRPHSRVGEQGSGAPWCFFKWLKAPHVRATMPYQRLW
jgi:predicted nucleic acid-binding protein